MVVERLKGKVFGVRRFGEGGGERKRGGCKFFVVRVLFCWFF